jgi:hypothetical protein
LVLPTCSKGRCRKKAKELDKVVAGLRNEASEPDGPVIARCREFVPLSKKNYRH